MNFQNIFWTNSNKLHKTAATAAQLIDYQSLLTAQNTRLTTKNLLTNPPGST